MSTKYLKKYVHLVFLYFIEVLPTSFFKTGSKTIKVKYHNVLFVGSVGVSSVEKEIYKEIWKKFMF